MMGANAALLALRKKNAVTGAIEPVWEQPAELDFVEAITEAQASQALMAGDPGSTRAAEFVMRHTGLAELRRPDGTDPNAAAALNAAAAAANAQSAAVIARVLADVLQLQRDQADVVNIKATE
jgi:hypothetical protein